MIRNKTRRPLSVPLPRGKKLHLSPGKTGQIAETAVEHPAVKKQIEAGEIEVLGDDPRPGDLLGSTAPRGRGVAPGHPGGGSVRSSGDR